MKIKFVDADLHAGNNYYYNLFECIKSRKVWKLMRDIETMNNHFRTSLTNYRNV